MDHNPIQYMGSYHILLNPDTSQKGKHQAPVHTAGCSAQRLGPSTPAPASLGSIGDAEPRASTPDLLTQK